MTSDREERRELLPAIFEHSLSLDRPERKQSRSLTLFERMAARLDEIAANTRGDAHAVAAYIPRSGFGADEKNEGKIGASAEKISRLLGNPTTEPKQTVMAIPWENKGLINQKGRKEDKKESTPTIAREATRGRVARKADAVAKKQMQAATPRLDEANAIARGERQAEAHADSIVDAIRSGLERVGAFFKDTNKKTAEVTTDSKDTIGYALGGPIYGVMKELEDAMPQIKGGQGDKAKERKDEGREFAKAVEAHTARRRDEKGRFIKPDQNEVRRETEQNDTLRDQLELEEQEAKKEAKRHKELVRAVKANRRDLLDKFLDRRASRGGRSVLREKTVIKERSPKGEFSRPNRQTSATEARFARGNTRHGNLRRAGGVATGTIAKGGAALGGLVGMLPGIGQAIALGTAAYEGFQGWNDKDLHKQAFGLKDGQEATTGQKASAAAASILDMGGLTSGLLEMFGLEFDRAGVAKSIYELGSNIATVARDFMDTAGPLLSQVWGGIEDLAGKAWQGAKDVGGAVTSFATDVWDKGGEVAGAIANWAGNAIDQGAGVLSEIWKGAGETVSGIWGKLGAFATGTLARAGELLSNLWKGITDLPGKIFDGVKDLATGAIESGGKLLSDGWAATKNFVGGLFGDDEAEAKEAPKQQEGRQSASQVADMTQGAKSESSVDSRIAAPTMPESVKIPAITIPAPDIPVVKLLKPEELTKNILTSSEAANGQLALEQINQKAREEKEHTELVDKLGDIDQGIKAQTKMLDNYLRGDDIPDDFGIVGAMNGVTAAIQNMRFGGSSGNYWAGGYSGNYSGAVASATYSGLGDVVNMGETGGKGTAMISTGAGDHGGVSYGRSQLASKVGSIQAALKWARANGFEDIANQLEPLQGDAGSRQGQFAQKWAQLAAEKGGRLEQFDRAYQKKGYYDPMMVKIRQANPELARRIDANPALQEQVLSTSVQYGMNSSRYLTAANEALGKNANLSDRELLVAIQGIKSRDAQVDFKSSSARVQRSIANRHGNAEKQRLLAIQDRFDRGEIKIDPQSGTAQVVPGASQARLAEAMKQGGSEAVNAGMSQMVAAATQDAKARNVGYFMRKAGYNGHLTGKDSSQGVIDCSGWVSEMGQRAMAEMNKAMGAEVFSKDARQAFKKGANGGAAGIIEAVSNYNGGKLFTNEQLTPDQAREGMVIGLAKAGDTRVSERFKGIGHVVQTYRDPQTGELMVSESRGGKGVMNSRYSDWYAQYQKKGYKMYGSDLSTMADASKIAPKQPESQVQIAQAERVKLQYQKALVEDLQARTASTPSSLASVAPGQREAAIAQARLPGIARNGREREKTESIRKIDPEREVQVKAPDQAAVLQALAQIVQAVQAVQATNEKVVSAIRQLAANNGAPNIGMEFSDAASRAMANG